VALTDQDILSEIQTAFIEPNDGGASWQSGLWTPAEVIGYCNQRQHRFLKETALLNSQLPIPVPANTTLLNLPDVWVATTRVSWRNNVSRELISLTHGSVWEADLMMPSWTTTSGLRPLTYSDVEPPETLQIFIMPGVAQAGVLTVLCVALAGILDGTGEIWTVPYEFVPAIKYGVMADMLNKVGRAQWATKARYCEMRFQEGIVAAKLLMESWS
jgi:hypothetical protein